MDQEIMIADRFDGIPHPAQTQKLVGHVSSVQFLLQQYASCRMHHAWLISGERGIGKATLAMQMAKHVFRHPDPATAPTTFDQDGLADAVAGKVAARSHPNLLHLTRPWDSKAKRFKTQLTVDEVRQTIPFFGTSRGEAGWRVTIVDAGDDMNNAAANALLKILEEPPDNTLFFIISHSPAKILPTIRSRCQQLMLKPLSDDEILEVLAEISVSEGMAREEQQLLLQLAQGSVRQAILLARGEGLELYRKFAGACENLQSPDWLQVHALADATTLKGREDKYRLLIGFAERLMERAATGADGDKKAVSMLARWAEVWEKSRKQVSLAESYNLDRKQVIINLFQNMSEAARAEAGR